jgi:excisionase family DNA binding protein
MELQDVKKPKIMTLYSLHEVAKFMGVNYMTLYRLVKGGKISCINVAQNGNKPIFKITAEELQRYYNSVPGASKGDQGIN